MEVTEKCERLDVQYQDLPVGFQRLQMKRMNPLATIELSPKQREELLKVLKARFEKNMNRHKGLEWAKVQARLEANTEKLWSLNEMERTSGEPDVVRNSGAKP